MAQKPMTKNQLVTELAERTSLDKKSTNAVLEALTAVVTENVSSGGAVAIQGLGKFYCRERKARTVRNPATGEQIHKDADRVVKVTVAKALKDSVN